MATIDTSIEINAQIDKVWDIISDLDAEPKFWRGTKETKIISRDGNVITREIIIAFRDSKCMQKNHSRTQRKDPCGIYRRYNQRFENTKSQI